MHRRQGDAENDDEDEHLLQARAEPGGGRAHVADLAEHRVLVRREERVEAVHDHLQAAPAAGFQAVENRRQKLDDQHGRVGHDAERDLEHGRIELPLGRDEEVVGVPGPAQVDHDREAGQAVAEHAGQDAGPDQRVVMHVVADIDQDGHRVAAAGDGRAGGDVVGDPDAPGIAVAHVGDRPDAFHAADGDQDDADQGESQQDEEGRGENPAFLLLEFVVAHLLCFLLWGRRRAQAALRPSSGSGRR